MLVNYKKYNWSKNSSDKVHKVEHKFCKINVILVWTII